MSKVSDERKYLILLCKAVREHIDIMDELMSQPSTVERGNQVAKLLNSLEMAHDRSSHFGLGNKLGAKW